ncbi:MAG: ion transporter [Planctomycetota bacterium]|nr:ion transporter [Planctomycetota bacterium]
MQNFIRYQVCPRCRTIVDSSFFNVFITTLIVINSVLIGIELDHNVASIALIQKVILACFTLEIGIRWFGKENARDYLTNYWNWFDIFLVSLTFAPDTWIPNPQLLTSLRILRVFRVFRLVKAFPELQVITKVLFKSISSLFSVCLLVIIVMYVYSIIGVLLFRDQSVVITAIGEVVDPFASVPEAMFSMFRVLTGEDWTDLRYDLLAGKSASGAFVVTVFFMSFYISTAFLLINLVVGAVCNNYDSVMKENLDSMQEESDSELQQLEQKLDIILERLADLEKSSPQ